MALNLNAVGQVIGPETFEYDEDDVILYALGIGAGPDELQYVYEKGLKVIPTFAVVAARGGRLSPLKLLNADLTRLLHGENRVEVYRPLPPRLRFSAACTVKAIYDKGKGAVVVSEIEGKDESGGPLFKNISSSFIRGEGGFGGERGPSGPKNLPPERPPDVTVVLPTRPDQAALYRLSGDKNPLHVDPEFARRSGFERPILHGLCTYGHVARAVIRACCDNDADRLGALEVRFAEVVYPGETLTTDVWRVEPKRVVLQTRVDDRLVISHAAAELL